MKILEIHDERKLDVLTMALIHEIGHTADLKAKCAELGCSTSDLDDRLAHLNILLKTITTLPWV